MVMAPAVEVAKNEDSFLVLDSPLEFSAVKNTLVGAPVGKRGPVPSVRSKQMIGQVLTVEIDKIDHDICEAGEEDSFFVADLGEVVRSCNLWRSRLPQVVPHYAVKCNTDPMVVKLLGRMGVNFDCASKQEIDTVLSHGFDSSRIVYANPCKTNSFIRHAKMSNVNLTTVDNVQELLKLQKFHPKCRVLIRIATDDETAQCRLSTKFGCTLECAISEMLPKCKELGLDAVGVAFHVGSGAKDFDSIYKAVRDSREIFDAAEALGLSMNLLDIGGGFERETFEESSNMVNLSLAKFFPATYSKSKGITFIAEPGRFMVADAFTLATHIIARRDLSVAKDGMEAMVYINDGVYGNLNCILFDHQHPTAKVLKHAGQMYYDVDSAYGQHKFSIWGPTCDGLDCVSSSCVLPFNVQIGDWLYFSNLGAYTSAATTTFNGFSGCARVKYVASEDVGVFGLGELGDF